MTIKLEWRPTTDFGYDYYFWLGEVKVGSVSYLAHRSEEPSWAANTTLPIPDWKHGPYLGLHYTLPSAKEAVEKAVDRFLAQTGLKS